MLKLQEKLTKWDKKKVRRMVTIGCVIKTPGSSKNNKTGSWRTFKPILDKEKCILLDLINALS